MKPCAWCAEEIQDAAIVCRHCGRNQRSGSPGTVGEYLPSTASTTNVLAIISLVVSVAAFPILPGIGHGIAVYLGYRARSEIAASGGTQGGTALATAGIVIGWVGVVLAVAVLFTVCSLANRVG